MSRPTIRRIIERAIELQPEAVLIPDTEFRKLFDETAERDFGVEAPDTKWRHWSVERLRKQIKAEQKGTRSNKDVYASSFLAARLQYRISVVSIRDMSKLFEMGASTALDYVENTRQILQTTHDDCQASLNMIQGVMTTEDTGNPDQRRAKEGAAALVLEHVEHISRVEKELRQTEKMIKDLRLRMSVTSEHVLPASFVYLMALLDSFVADTLRYYYRRDPWQMNRKMNLPERHQKELSEQRKVPYEAIFRSKSYDEVLSYVVEREVGLITRGDADSQLTALEGCGIDMNRVDAPTALEMSATRNIYVHNGGRIDPEYLRKSKACWHTRGGCPFKLGDIRTLSPKYIHDAADWGDALIQTITLSVNKPRARRPRRSAS